MPAHETVESPDDTTVFDYHDLTAPSVGDVYAARDVIHQYLLRTPLVQSEPLSAELDADVCLKREDSLPTGAFRVRGGINLVHDLTAEFRETGLVTTSTGNHGQSITYAGSALDVPVRIFVPEDANPAKVGPSSGTARPLRTMVLIMTRPERTLRSSQSRRASCTITWLMNPG